MISINFAGLTLGNKPAPVAPETPVAPITAELEKALASAKSGKPTKISGKFAGEASNLAREKGWSGGATSVHPELRKLVEATGETSGEMPAKVSDDDITLRPSARGGVYQTFEFKVEGLDKPQNCLVPADVSEVVNGTPFTLVIAKGERGWNYSAQF